MRGDCDVDISLLKQDYGLSDRAIAAMSGVTGKLRVWAAREIGRIELAGLDWCDGVSVKLPLHGAERRRVVEGERHRRGTLLLSRDRCSA